MTLVALFNARFIAAKSLLLTWRIKRCSFVLADRDIMRAIADRFRVSAVADGFVGFVIARCFGIGVGEVAWAAPASCAPELDSPTSNEMIAAAVPVIIF